MRASDCAAQRCRAEFPVLLHALVVALWKRPGRVGGIAIAVLAAMLLFGNLTFPLLEPDEGRYAEIPLLMLQRHELLVPMLHGKPYNDRDYRGSYYGSRYKYQGGYGYAYGYPGGYVAYGVPYGGYVTYDSGQPVVEPVTPAQAEIPEGFLRLLVTPRFADVIVDGVVAGTVDDFGGTREQALPAGPHRIRIEAPGYEPVEFDVRVPVGDTISLRRELVPLTAPPRPAQPTAPERGASAMAPAVRRAFYAIPNCYLGNTMPTAEVLPAGCSLKDVRVLPQ